MKQKKIDWEEVDKQSDEYLKKCMFVDNEIQKERSQQKSIEDTSRDIEKVNQFTEKQNIPSVTLELESDS